MTKRKGKGKPKKQSNNTHQPGNSFAALSPNDIGEMNAHLTERIRQTASQAHGAPPGDFIPVAVASRANNDIREYYEIANKPVKGGRWLEQPEFPTISEILPGNPAAFRNDENLALIDIEAEGVLRPHKVEGAYTDKDAYLGTTYELLREDTIRPMREVIKEIRDDPYKDECEYENKGIGVYDPVYITGLVCSMRGLATRVAFSLSRVKKHIRWEQSKRLITGTLVALSPANDAFKSKCILATVAARPLSALDQNPPEIDLFFARPEEQEIDPTQKWIMIECRSSFFEASRHTLLALQHLMREPFPMSEHLVEAQSNIDPPDYLVHNPNMSLSSLVSMEESKNFERFNVLENWPSPSSWSLDNSQSAALQRILTKKLAIVQGPPGTGKTFVSVAALKAHCDNMLRDDAPMIVTAQTNHAVDQILRHTMEFESNIIRLGGRSKDKEVKKRTLYEVRSEMPPKQQVGSQKIQAQVALRKCTGELLSLLSPLEANTSPLDCKVLRQFGLITATQAESLELDSQCTMGASPGENPGLLMEQWMGKSLATCHRPSQPDDFGVGFEEEDFEVEQLLELEAEAAAKDDDDDIEALKGPVILLSDNYTGKATSTLTSTAEIKELLEMSPDLTTISPQDRGVIYNYFKREIKKVLVAEVRNLAIKYSKNVLQRKVGMWEQDAHILHKARIIGCTTTGLSKYRPLIASLRPRIIMVEEAAETLEAPVTAACIPSLEQLILVGDHRQLRPHTQVHKHENAPYYLNLSLFERLVNNEVGMSTLTKQRRMIPEVRRLLGPIYGKILRDHESVKDIANRPPVEGMGGLNSFFFCHEMPESRDSYLSCYNEHESKMIVGFVDYLLLNGVNPSKITLLTFYNGQRKNLIKFLQLHPNLRGFFFNVVTVDGYQGEENDIVILSLVRNSKKGGIGFLQNENRACVALSRAKRGFYLFGNGEKMASESRIWADVISIMYGRENDRVDARRKIGYFFPIQCTHHGRKTWIQEPEDWDLVQGGCDLPCGGILPCQHKCPYRCHPFEHDRVNCMQKCIRVLSCGHTCIAMCCDPCRCQTCEHRLKGMKSIVKPAATGAKSTLPLTPVSGRSSNYASIVTQQDSSEVHGNVVAYSKSVATAGDASSSRKASAEEVADLRQALEPTADTPFYALASPATPVPHQQEYRQLPENLLIDIDFGIQNNFVDSASPSKVAGKYESKEKGKGPEKGKGKGKSDLLPNLLD